MFNICSIAAQPVSAVTGVEEAVILVLASVCLGLAMNIAITNPNWEGALSPLYNALSSSVQASVDHAASAIQFGYNVVYVWNPQEYANLTTEIINYFHNNSFSETPGTITPSSSDGKIGFTSSTSFSMYYPNGTDSVNYYLPSGVLTVYGRVTDRSVFPSCSYINNVYSSANSGWKAINSDGFGACAFNYASIPNNIYDSYITPYLYSSAHENDYLKVNKNYNAIFRLTDLKASNNSQYGAYFFFDSLNNIYGIASSNGQYYFDNVSTHTKYNDLTFPSLLALTNWFRNSLGFVTSSSSDVLPYTPPITDTGITFDYDTSISAQTTNVNNATAAGSLSTVIPGTVADLGVLADSPTSVLNPTVAATMVGVYPSDIPQIDKSPSLWLQKFPFCIPFDLSRIISDLQAPPEAPELSFIILPENFFDLGNDAYYVDIDFTPFAQFVSILRFFISLGFVLFLIILTRDIIKG